MLLSKRFRQFGVFFMSKEKKSEKNQGPKIGAEEIQSRLEQAEKERDEIKDALQRVQAEFENSRKRLEKEKQDFLGNANAGIVKDFLPLLDSVESAEKNIGESEDFSKEDATKGVGLIKKQLLAILESHGLKEMDSVEKKFDPMKHDALMQGKEESMEEGIVIEEFQKGYTLNGKILRHAKVKVNKK